MSDKICGLCFHDPEYVKNIIEAGKDRASLTNRINALHEHKIRQIDENRKISKRVDEIQKFADSHLSCWNALDDKIESIGTTLIDNVRHLNERLNELEKELKCTQDALTDRNTEFFDLRDEVRKIMQGYNPKPHKCPNCNFLGAIEFESAEEASQYGTVMQPNGGKLFTWCKACEGKGIVWG